jgi:hypothetical protein
MKMVVQSLFQLRRSRIFWAVPNAIPNLRARTLQPPSPFALAARISSTISGVSFFARLLAMCASRRPLSVACRRFSALVHHSRFESELFCLLQSIWFTSQLSSSVVSKKASATNRCTSFVDFWLPFDRTTRMYPVLVEDCRKTRPRFKAVANRCLTLWSRLLTLPKELTSYHPSYPAITCHFSMRQIVSR